MNRYKPDANLSNDAVRDYWRDAKAAPAVIAAEPVPQVQAAATLPATVTLNELAAFCQRYGAVVAAGQPWPVVKVIA